MWLQAISSVQRKSSKSRTFVKTHCPLTLKEEVECRFFALDLPAYIIDILQKAYVGFDKFESPAGVELFAFFDDTICGFLGSSDNVGSRFGCILGKCLQRIFADYMHYRQFDNFLLS